MHIESYKEMISELDHKKVLVSRSINSAVITER